MRKVLRVCNKQGNPWYDVLSRDKQKQTYGGSLLADYTRRGGYDTIRLNWDIGSDRTVYRLPAEHEWYGDNPLPSPRKLNPLQESMQLKCLEVEAYGGGKYDLKNGGRLLWRRQEGVFYELRLSQYKTLLSLEASLPKLLFGHNKYPVPLELLPDAFAELTARGRAFIGADLPPADELEAWRIDATSDVKLRSEFEVALVGRVLADCSLNNAMPTRYPTGGSVSWPASGGHPGARCYGKSEETGDEKIKGLYRSEVQVMGGKQFRKALAFAVERGDLLPSVLSGRGTRCLRAGTLATEPGVCTGLLGPLTSVLDSAINLVREVNAVTAVEAVILLEQKAGVSRSRAAQLLGYAHIVRLVGWRLTGLDRSNVWRAKKEFELAGVDPAVIEFGAMEKLTAGAGMALAGAVLGGVAVAGVVIGDALADALIPDKPGPAKCSKPGPVPAGELEKAA